MTALANSNKRFSTSMWPAKMSPFRLAEIHRRLGDWLMIDLDPKALNDEAMRELLPEWRGTIAELVSDALRTRLDATWVFGIGVAVGVLVNMYVAGHR